MKAERTYSLSTLITFALFALGFGFGAGMVVGGAPEAGTPDPIRSGGGVPSGMARLERADPPRSEGSGLGEIADGTADLGGLSGGPGADASPEAGSGEAGGEGPPGAEGKGRGEEAPGEGRADPEKVAAAQGIFDELKGLDEGKTDPEQLLEMLGRLGDLGEEEAAYFVQQYLASKGKGGSAVEREAALMLAVLSGGEYVADFLSDFLTDPTTPRADRIRFLQNIGNPMEPAYSMDRIPMDGALAVTAYDLLESRNSLERKGAASLLGGLDTPQSRATLEQVVENERDLRVRIAAIRSLGRVGDLSTKEFLQRFSRTLAASPRSRPFKRLKGPLKGAIRKLQQRFPD